MSESTQDAIDKINQLAGQPSAPAPASTPAEQIGLAAGMAAGAAAMTGGSQVMLAQAQSGALKFDPETGQSLINTLNKHIEDLNHLGQNMGQITQSTKLGMTVGGQAMSKFNLDVAQSGDKAFVPVHGQFVQTLATMVQAIQTAVDNYANTESHNAHQLKAKD
jgi:hypothetical protein